jgi:phage terminase large subunit-like protein
VIVAGAFQSPAAVFPKNRVLDWWIKIDSFFTSLHRKRRLSHRFSAADFIRDEQELEETCKHSVKTLSGDTPMLKGSDQPTNGQQLLKQLREQYIDATHRAKPPQKKRPSRPAIQQSHEGVKVKRLK